MKRALLHVCVYCSPLLIVVFPFIANAFAGGDGTSGNPWQITTPAELNDVRNYMGTANSGVHFKVMNDISLDVAPYNTSVGWAPLGAASASLHFHGTFDGNGKTISGLFINRSGTDYVGLFSYNEGTIKNVVLTGVNISGDEITGSLVGLSTGTVASSSAAGAMTAGNYSGGLVGSNSGPGIITGAASYVNFTGKTGAQYLGGLTSENYTNGIIRFSYAHGSVTGNSSYVGGLSGRNYLSTATSTYSKGAVTGGVTGVGGLFGGTVSGTVNGSYWDTETSGKSTTIGGGTGKTTAEMKTQSTYAGWDFNTVWAIHPSINGGYPYLRWQTLPSSDTTAPSVSITSPSADETVSGNSVTLSATASDDVALTGVSFYVNGVLQGSEDTSSPYSVVWDSTATSSGNKTVIAVARDISNNYATSSGISITVSNAGPTPTGVQAVAGDTSATITWTTGAVSSSRVFFGPATYLASSTIEADVSPRVTGHSVSLSGLPACTEYLYVAVSRNAALDAATSTQGSFQTTGCTESATIVSSASEEVDTAVGGTLTEGVLTLVVPTSFTTSADSAVFQILELEGATFFAGIDGPTGLNRVGNSVFNLKALTDTTTSISSFSAPLSVSFSYSANDAAGLDESTFVIYRYNGSSWSALSNCSTNTSTRTVTCETTAFSDFALFGQTASAPAAQAAQAVGSASNSSSGTTVQMRFQNLIALGLYSAAYELMNQYPSEFTNQTTASTHPKLSISRNLGLGMKGQDVRQLQEFLIKANTGPRSKELASIGATGYFGGYTQNALREFQKAAGIIPHSGFCGPITRKFLGQ